MQRTITHPVTFQGVGLHSGQPATVTLCPAPAGAGIVFRRVDLAMARNRIPALWHLVEHMPLCTRLVNDDGVSINTVEHVMAALVGCGIHNALVDVDGPEVPILDGSAEPFVIGILAKGLCLLGEPVRALRVLRRIDARRGGSWACLMPHDTLRIEFDIAFEDAAIGVQTKSLDMANGSFVRELSNSRTFCRKADVERMHANGLALGGTLENAVVVEGGQVLSPGGLRHADEAVRHKMLDALGDLGLAGLPILGHYHGFCAGHALTNALLHRLFADADNYEVILCPPDIDARLPGVGLHWGRIPQVA
ncbi:MAG: UDP-3-O-acyl-N-acetylglucosamine deacetylase [Roseovarius sp.]|nr:UDP-3-O-acyl-N-acetylglucosamine deacetylase [Roseovarius sp.]